MRRALIGFGAVFAVGLLALLAIGLTSGSSLAYTAGVSPANPLPVRAGVLACQAPLHLPDGASFDRVGFSVGTFRRPGPELTVQVLDEGSGRVLARGRLAAGYGDIDAVPQHVVPLGSRVRTGAPLRVCVRNEGRRRIAVYGQPGAASARTIGYLDGRPMDSDLSFELLTGERSTVALLPDMLDRAALFRAGWVTPLVLALLGLLILVAAPLALARAIARAAAEDGEHRAPVRP